MALTKIITDGITDDAVTSGKIPANAVGASELADDSVDTNAIQDQAVALSKLPHGTSSNDGKFLRANNGADPTFETVNTTPEGTAILSTGESGGTKFLREDGDGSCSWQAVSIPAGTTINGNNDHSVVTATGTANTLQGESKFTFDGSLVTTEKRMVIGNGTDFQIPSRSNTSSYTPQFQVTGAWNDPTHGGTMALNGRTDYPLLWLNSGASFSDNSGAGYIIFSIKDSAGNYCNTASISSHVDGTPGTNDSPGDLAFMTTSSGTCNPVQRMSISSKGTKNFGAFSNYSGGHNIFSGAASTSDFCARFDGVGSGSGNFIQFVNAYGQMGAITYNAGTTYYNTSSDYRLKENDVTISNGITRVKQLRPIRFNWKANKDLTVDGFIAHEVSPVVPEAVVGEKDATQTTYYGGSDTIPEGKKEGDVKEENAILPQQLDAAKLIPVLTAALQEAIGKIETLEAKVAALETA